MNIYQKDKIPSHLLEYFEPAEIGLEESPEQFIAALVDVFRELRRSLHSSGVLWLNMGDSYANDAKWGGSSGGNRTLALHGKTGVGRGKRNTGLKPKDLMGIPWMLAFALRADGWYLRSDIIWAKTNGMPESVTDRPSKSHEYIFMLTKSPRYFYDLDAMRRPLAKSSVQRLSQPKLATQTGSTRANGGAKTNGNMKAVGNAEGSNLGTVWSTSVGRTKYAHFATFPKKIVTPCVRLGTSAKGCCPACLEPWRRTVVKKRVPTRPGKDTKVSGNDSAVVGNRDPQRHCTVRQTKGWKPGCECPVADPIPCLILDPFVGSGTTLAVAVEEGRRAIGCELNPDYCKFIDRRMRTVVPDLFATV